MKCVNPECDREGDFAKGYCQRCYTRLRRSGSLRRTNVVNSGVCSVCGERAFAKNLCAKHYVQERHPLRWLWANVRSRYAGQCPESWDRFEAFLADVGERPTDRHKLIRLDGSKPYSKENVIWKAPVMADGRSSKSESKEYQRRWQLQRLFRMTLEEYQERFRAQDGCCFICREVETARDRKGRVKPLAVDHCHASDKVRDLLCNRCNHILGLAADKIDVLRSAVAYLERHASVDTPPPPS
jgi:Recombination endonuclease VII